MNPIFDRLKKNLARLQPQLKKYGIEAYRLYDRDIPEYPFIIDIYQDSAVVYDRSNDKIDNTEEKVGHWDQTLDALSELGFAKQFLKRRSSGKHHYQKLDQQQQNMIVREGPAKFLVNLTDYLDTGLFLDHRIMREKIFKQSNGLRVLNLFSYTGSVSVYAALGGASEVTSIDMSKTYTDWAMDNFRLNKLPVDSHRFIVEDVLAYLEGSQDQNYFDLIFLDPPTFSNSKKMEDSFEVEREQRFLIEHCLRRLKNGGTFYFSTNKRDFKLDETMRTRYSIQDISKKTIPFDFRDQKIHKVFLMQTTETP